MQQICLHEFEQHIHDTNYIVSLFEEGECHVRISYISDFGQAKILREAVNAIVQQFHISLKWRMRLMLIVDELNNNAIEHGSKHGDINYLNILIQYMSPTSVYVDISSEDAGTGKQTKTAADMEEMRKKSLTKDFSKHHSIRGRGLFLIIAHLVDALYFQDTPKRGLIVGIQKQINLGEE